MEAVDSTTGLTDREKKLIQGSRDVLLKNAAKTSVEISLKFFRDFPQYCNLYPFKGLSCEELKSNKDFLDECDRLTEAIDEWTAKVDEPDQLKENLKEIGQSYDDPGFCEQYFRDFEDTFMDYVVPLMDIKTLEAWRKLMRFAMNELAEWCK